MHNADHKMPKTSADTPGLSADPKKPKITPTVFSLNHDCLAEIFTYLPIEDIFRIYQADSRFKESVHIRYALDGVHCIDSEFVSNFPNAFIREYTEVYGKTCRSVKFKLLSPDVFIPLLADFRNLQELILSEITISGGDPASLPVGLNSLELDRCQIENDILEDWIPKLNSTLKSLRLVHRDYIVLPKLGAYTSLNNLSSLVIDGLTMESPELIGQLLANNKNQLQTVNIIDVPHCYNTIHLAIWVQLIELEQLNHLCLNQLDCMASIPIGRRLFPNLQFLQIHFDLTILTKVIDALACEETLKSLVIGESCTNSGRIPFVGLTRFKNLRHLEVLSGFWGEGTASSFAKLTQLHSLNLNCGSFCSSDEIFQLLRLTPFLHTLSLEQVSVGRRPNNLDLNCLEEQFEILSREHPKPFEYELSIREP